METIRNRTYDEERALYGSRNLLIQDCRFAGPADGESALKEAHNITVENCFFDLRYPFWHDTEITLDRIHMTENCRASLWYSSGVSIFNSELFGIKALRECSDIRMKDCKVISPEFGWSTTRAEFSDSSFEAEYFMMRSKDLVFKNITLKGKYSFQYVENAVFDHCNLDTKDCLWHAKNILVRNSTVKGEYLSWYSENVTFENCTIIGTQPLCYCKNLRLINCVMRDTDLAFERSEVMATLNAPILSIKNPLSGLIRVPSAGEIIMDIHEAKGEVVFEPEREARD